MPGPECGNLSVMQNFRAEEEKEDDKKGFFSMTDRNY